MWPRWTDSLRAESMFVMCLDISHVLHSIFSSFSVTLVKQEVKFKQTSINIVFLLYIFIRYILYLKPFPILTFIFFCWSQRKVPNAVLFILG